MKTYKLNEIDYKRILGRNVADAGKNDKPLALFWAASALELQVKSSEVWVNISSQFNTYEPWVTVEVNGAELARFIAPVEPQWICIARNMNPDKENLITIMKDDQPMSGEEKHSLFINGIGLSDEGQFCPLQPRELNIEFIGDSITSGEGLAGKPEENDWIAQWMRGSKTYAVQAAHKLNASWWTMSQCGWGICWGWDGNRNSVIPPHYENVCSLMWGDYQKSIGAHEPYNFAEKMDFVVLNLGTNDNGAFFQPPWKDESGKEYVLHTEKTSEKAIPSDGKIVQDGVKDFLKKIRKYNPSAKIIWCWGMIKMTAIPDYIVAGIEDYKKETGDNAVYSLPLDSMEDVEVLPEDKGSRGHPGPKTHRLAAEKIVDLINKLR